MSSPGCPTLALDLRCRRADRTGGITLAAIAACAPLLVAQTIGIGAIVGASILVFGTCVLALARAGWLGKRTLVRATWHRDGQWLLTEPSGRTVTAALHDSSRMSPFAVWLRWTVIEEEKAPACGRFPVVLLTPWDLPPSEFRRLLVRLRADRSQWQPLATSLPNS